jgi:hypothetical protein
MKTSISLAAFSIISTTTTYGRDPDWLGRRSAQLEQAISLNNNDEKIESLATFVRIGLRGRMDEEQRAIFQKSQTALLQIPGHATYFQNKLESLRSDILKAAKLPEDPHRMKVNSALGDYEDFRKQAFPILGLLPSGETVAVLGHFLTDPEGRDRKNTLGEPIFFSDVVPFPPNAGAAAIAIRQLGIDHPPFREHPSANDHYYYTPEEIDAWKEWWNEVKDGKRTYRFIGSSIVYGPDGPASKAQLQRIDRNRQRDASANSPRSAASSSEATEQPRTKTGIAIGGAALVLFASIFYVLRAKKRSPR